MAGIQNEGKESLRPPANGWVGVREKEKKEPSRSSSDLRTLAPECYGPKTRGSNASVPRPRDVSRTRRVIRRGLVYLLTLYHHLKLPAQCCFWACGHSSGRAPGGTLEYPCAGCPVLLPARSNDKYMASAPDRPSAPPSFDLSATPRAHDSPLCPAILLVFPLSRFFSFISCCPGLVVETSGERRPSLCTVAVRLPGLIPPHCGVTNALKRSSSIEMFWGMFSRNGIDCRDPYGCLPAIQIIRLRDVAVRDSQAFCYSMHGLTLCAFSVGMPRMSAWNGICERRIKRVSADYISHTPLRLQRTGRVLGRVAVRGQWVPYSWVERGGQSVGRIRVPCQAKRVGSAIG
ncbi:hypothetical protein B0H10DRAFT_2251536 [Mycena sp. CBHHK59/15]|nr:hypothetical protein B0H10DRAFT_2251536 [Mycena sp. CBHHK59/15]